MTSSSPTDPPLARLTVSTELGWAIQILSIVLDTFPTEGEASQLLDRVNAGEFFPLGELSVRVAYAGPKRPDPHDQKAINKTRAPARPAGGGDNRNPDE